MKTAHGSHCCKTCGCKYGDKGCPVVMGTEEQEGPCGEMYACPAAWDDMYEALHLIDNGPDPDEDIAFERDIIVLEEPAKKPEQRLIDADFLARQIVDDLYRAGAGENIHFHQHVVEKTILDWLAGSGRKWGK